MRCGPDVYGYRGGGGVWRRWIGASSCGCGCGGEALGAREERDAFAAGYGEELRFWDGVGAHERDDFGVADYCGACFQGHCVGAREAGWRGLA